MAKTQAFPGTPAPQLPPWANNGQGTAGSLSQRFLDKYGAKPKMVGGGWLGDFGPNGPPNSNNGLGLSPWPLSPTPGGRGNAIPMPTDPALPASGLGMTINPKLDTSRIGPGIGGSIGTGVQDATASPSGVNWSTAASGLKSMIPYASNIANAFRRPPQPIRPGMASPVTFSRIDNSNERANITTQTRGADMGADRGLDGNTAAAYKAANLSTKLHAFGDSYARENAANASISNEQNQFNSGIQQRNLEKTDQYNDKVVESKIAQQRNQSANISNASDKFIAQENVKAQRALDEQKWTDTKRLFGDVSGRFGDYAKDPDGYLAKLKEYQDELTSKRQADLEARKLTNPGVATNAALVTKGKMGGMMGGKSMNRVSKMRKVY